jgi:hypothetical protein
MSRWRLLKHTLVYFPVQNGYALQYGLPIGVILHNQVSYKTKLTLDRVLWQTQTHFFLRQTSFFFFFKCYVFQIHAFERTKEARIVRRAVEHQRPNTADTAQVQYCNVQPSRETPPSLHTQARTLLFIFAALPSLARFSPFPLSPPPAAAGGMPIYTFRGVDVDFPFDAYDCQITYMDRVLESLQQVTNPPPRPAPKPSALNPCGHKISLDSYGSAPRCTGGWTYRGRTRFWRARRGRGRRSACCARPWRGAAPLASSCRADAAAAALGASCRLTEASPPVASS